MATLKSIPIAQIHVGERMRPVDEDEAAAIAASMAARGLINPITVRPTPAANGGKTPYTLVAGGNRLRAAVLNEWPEIDALVVSTDIAEAQLIEISENIFRNKLSPVDQGVFVAKFREIHEEKYGKIQRGGDRKSNCNDCTLIFANGKELSERVQERLGIGQRTYYNALKIGTKLSPALRSALRGTPAEFDGKFALKLSGLPETEQAAVVGALKIEPDPYKAFEILRPKKPAADPQSAALKKLISTWGATDAMTRGAFLAHIGIDPLDVPDAINQEDAA